MKRYWVKTIVYAESREAVRNYFEDLESTDDVEPQGSDVYDEEE